MPKLIGFIGKGGSGKTTITSLFLKYILEKETQPVLVIDSDPNSCLAQLLDLKIDRTIGNIKTDLLKNSKDITESSLSKYDYCEYALTNAIIEENGFDFVVMGRPDGPGCYCMINNVIKIMIEKLKKNYKYIIVDCEAGLEHISRKTLGDIDVSFIISDMSKKGILTAENQYLLMKDLNILPPHIYLLINNVADDLLVKDYYPVIRQVENERLKFGGIIHNDINISRYELDNKNFLNLPDDTVSYKDLKNIFDNLNIF